MARMTSATDVSRRTPAGSRGGPTITKSLCITPATVDEIAGLNVAMLGGWRVHQHDVRVSTAGHAQRGPRADGDHLDLDAPLHLESRHQHVEQSAVLRAGRRREDDGRLRVRGSSQGRCDNERESGGETEERASLVHNSRFGRDRCYPITS